MQADNKSSTSETSGTFTTLEESEDSPEGSASRFVTTEQRVRPRPHRAQNKEKSDLEQKEALFASAISALREGIEKKPSSAFCEYLCERLDKFPSHKREEIQDEILDLVRARSKDLQSEVIVVVPEDAS